MSYKKRYLFEHNVDWFGCINGRWIYAASRGGRLPERVNDENLLPGFREYVLICLIFSMA